MEYDSVPSQIAQRIVRASNEENQSAFQSALQANISSLKRKNKKEKQKEEENNEQTRNCTQSENLNTLGKR